MIGRRHDLAQLVGDQDDSDAALPQGAQNVEQTIGLLWRQHRAGFVQDEDVRTPEQHLQDFHALLLANRKIGDAGIGIDRQAVVACQPRQLGPCRRQPAGQQQAALGTQHQVLEHGEGVDQHEVLVDHANAVDDGVARAIHLDRPAADPYLACIGTVEPVKNAHQGRLAGAVFAHDAGDRPRLDPERHAANGMNAAKRLVDPAQLDGRCRRRQGLHELLLI